jgi:hypothetical protein
MYIAHHGTGIAARKASFTVLLQNALVADGKTLEIRVVHRIGLPGARDLWMFRCPYERSDVGVEREHVHAIAGRQIENG